ncbi:hypothetical protein LK994_01535 [Ferruginibacter lapsinanis]|uniref:hypothetical protein n=1 Tax=Ferruginibacter lapsinanis TaxID=563172 RepID=UPI001E3952BB|nr:hypothetical protein [Ferruginibacter lapsinanis]UEG50156.1 hypothetical protein LK994_01535 [Ferruginibacter lapsinanis]
MRNFNKYFGLMAMILGGLIGFILFVILIFYILKVLSITMFNIPGFDSFFSIVVLIIPYAVFFAGYYYLHKKIPLSTSKFSRVLARTLLTLGSLICFTAIVLLTLKFFGLRKIWLNTLNDNSHFVLVSQILFLFITAAVIAGGDAKEKDWMDKDAA